MERLGMERLGTTTNRTPFLPFGTVCFRSFLPSLTLWLSSNVRPHGGFAFEANSTPRENQTKTIYSPTSIADTFLVFSYQGVRFQDRENLPYCQLALEVTLGLPIEFTSALQ